MWDDFFTFLNYLYDLKDAPIGSFQLIVVEEEFFQTGWRECFGLDHLNIANLMNMLVVTIDYCCQSVADYGTFC